MGHAAFKDVLPQLGRAAAGLRFEDLPPNVVMRAKQRVLDTLGCLVAGYEAGIAQEIRKMSDMQDVKDKLALLGAEAMSSTPEAFAQRIRDDLSKWGKIVRDTGAKAD